MSAAAAGLPGALRLHCLESVTNAIRNIEPWFVKLFML
jgi:hypothetical protein